MSSEASSKTAKAPMGSTAPLREPMKNDFHLELPAARMGIEIMAPSGTCWIAIPNDTAIALANEMFDGGDPARIVPALQNLAASCGNLVIVTNDVFSDGVVYPDSTQDYLCRLAQINAAAARLADCVAEVVYSIPVMLKGSLNIG